MHKPDQELADCLQQLSLWMDGMRQFIAVTKSNWTRGTTRDYLLGQKLGQDSLKLKKQIAVLAERYKVPAGESEAAQSEGENGSDSVNVAKPEAIDVRR